jgi:multicomponent Na+:H+ antiporter subunit C
MEMLICISVGVLFSAGLYLLLQGSVIKTVLGLGVISQAANLVIFIVGGLTVGSVPIITGKTEAESVADPLVQALVLTAIVIGFGLSAFLLTLAYKIHKEVGSDDLNDMRNLRG